MKQYNFSYSFYQNGNTERSKPRPKLIIIQSASMLGMTLQEKYKNFNHFKNTDFPLHSKDQVNEIHTKNLMVVFKKS